MRRLLEVTKKKDRLLTEFFLAKLEILLRIMTQFHDVRPFNPQNPEFGFQRQPAELGDRRESFVGMETRNQTG